MTWVVKRTDTFLESLRDIRKNKEALAALEKKLLRLREDPCMWAAGFQANSMARNLLEFQENIA